MLTVENQPGKNQAAPLADRMRPQTLEDFFGQQELVGENSFLRKAILADQVPSMILWGPPGSGKTTLAAVIAKVTKADFIKISAIFIYIVVFLTSCSNNVYTVAFVKK